MKTLMYAALFVAAVPCLLPAEAVSPTATATTLTASLDGRAWMDGGRLLVSGAALGVHSEKDARLSAVRDAASSAAEFLDKKGVAKPALVRRAIEDSLLRETPISGQDYGDVRIENQCQERWKDERGQDSWSMHLTISVLLGKGKGH